MPDIDIEVTDSHPERHTAAVIQLLEHMLKDTLLFAEGAAKGKVPRRTGNLGRNIGHSPIHHVGNLYTGAAGVGKTAPYGKWVESGTGIFGVFHTPIVPKTGNYLRWKSFIPTLAPRDRPFAYARSVKGQKGQHFMKYAYMMTRTAYIPQRLQLLKHEIQAVMNKP